MQECGFPLGTDLKLWGWMLFLKLCCHSESPHTLPHRHNIRVGHSVALIDYVPSCEWVVYSYCIYEEK